MAEYNWQQLLQQAEEAGLEFELQPPGEYAVEVATVNVKKAQGGKDKIGVQLKITEGPRAGKSFWDNITISPENPKAMAIFFRTVAAYGGDINTLRSGGGLEALAQQFVGRRGRVVLAHRTWNNKALHDVKSFKADTTPFVPPTTENTYIPPTAEQPVFTEQPQAAPAVVGQSVPF